MLDPCIAESYIVPYTKYFNDNTLRIINGYIFYLLNIKTHVQTVMIYITPENLFETTKLNHIYISCGAHGMTHTQIKKLKHLGLC